MTDFRVEKLQQALNKGELFEYMVGENGYDYVSPYADVPTDEDVVFTSISEYYKATKDDSIWRYFEASWIAMSMDPIYSWESLYYLSNYLYYSKLKGSYLLDINRILPVLISNIKSNKEALSQNRQWVGRGFKDGLWGDVKRMVTNINRAHGLQIEL